MTTHEISNNVSRQVNLKDLNFRDEDNYEEIYSDEERKKLLKVVLNHPEDVIARMFVILFCMPLRLGEVRSIKWSDVDFENHTKGKRKKCNRYIPLSKQPKICFVGNTNYKRMPMKIPLFSALPMV